MSIKLPKDAKVQTGDVVRIRQTVEDNGVLRGFHGIVTAVFDSSDAAQGQIVFVNVWAYVKTPEGRLIADPSNVIAYDAVFSREQVRPVLRKDGATV